MDVGNIIQGLTDKVESYAGQIGNLMGVICGIGALLYIGSKVWKNMANGEPLDIFPLLRPFVIGFFVVNFSLVKAPVDFLIERVERLNYSYLERIFGTVEDRAKAIGQKAAADASARKAKKDAERAELLKNKNSLERILENLKDGAEVVGQAVGGNFTIGLSSILTGILSGLAHALKSVIVWYYQYVSLIYRCILGLFGPVAFTIAMFPGFKDGVMNWFAKYIAISLWPVVFTLLSFLIGSIQTELLVSSAFSSEWYNIGLALSAAEWQALLLDLIEIAVYLTVPAIVGWIIPNGDASSALGGVKAIVSSVMMVAGAALGAATGGKLKKKK